MNWAGKSSVFLVAVMAIVLTGLFGATAQAEVLRPAVGEESAFFYPSFPLEGGPYIMAASLWNGAGSADSLIVVFSEQIDSTEVSLDDFVLDGFTATAIHRTGLPSMKYIVIDGIAGVSAGADSIGLIWGSVEGVDGSVSKDIGLVPVTQGPVVVDVVYDQSYSSASVLGPYDANAPAFEVYFDHPVGIATGQAATIFRVTPELLGTLLTNTVNAATASISIARNPAAGSDSLLWMHPGIAKMWLDVDDVYWTGLNAIKNTAQKTVVRNQGPALMAAYYNDMDTHVGADNLADDEVWLVFDQPIPTESLGTVATQYVPGWATSFDAAAEQVRQPSGAAYANVVIITNPLTDTMVSPTDPDDQWIREASPNFHVDYQDVAGPGRMGRCRPGVGMVRAVYFDRETNDPADDQLHIWFNEELVTGDVTLEDFVITPYIPSWQTQTNITVENINSLGHVVIGGWENVTALAGARLPGGYFLRMDADDAFSGEDTHSGCDGQSLIPIFDDSKPGRVRLDEVPWLTYKRYNESTFADTCFLAWQETGATDDSDDNFLFFTNQDGMALDDLFIQNYRHNALAVHNFRPWTVDGQVQRIAVDITAGQLTTDGHPVTHGDELRFMLVPGRYWGTFADGDGEAVLKFSTAIIAGPICPPQDFDANDDDIIHVTAVAEAGVDSSWTRSIFGDANAAPCGSWVYIFDRCWVDEPGDAVELGRGLINANKSFDAIVLDDSVVDPDTLEYIYVYAWDDGAWSTCLAILNDIALPEFALDDGAIPDADRFNPFRIYKADDYVNILLTAWDSHVIEGKGDYSLSDLLEVTADFSHLDNRTTLPAALGSYPINAVPLVSMGNDEIDNDGDWIANDPNIDINDDGVMDFPEPYVDENQDGSFDPGETFVDKDGDDLCDCIGGSGDDYDLNLDSADPDEHAVYEIRLLAAGDADLYNDVVKGFQVLDPVTDPTGMTNFGEIKDIPVPLTVTDPYLDMTYVYTEDEAPFTCEMDEVPPTISEVTELYSLGTYTEASVTTDNLIVPTDPVYNLGRFFNFRVETQSDDDVLFGAVQIKEHASATWDELTLDPPGWNANPTVPGVAGFDDDRDYTVAVDTDEDGDIDDGEGMDLSDSEVVDAVQDSTADADADAGDGIYRTTDRRDNDNDAFFIFEPYYDVDGGTGSSQLTQKVVWFNIDESTTNDIDDNFDGSVDNASEVETYSAQGDDNEDGILDGEAVELTAYGINPAKDINAGRFFCVFDSTYDGAFYVDASHVEGEHAGDMSTDGGDIRALTEFVPFSYGVLDANGAIDTDGPLPDLPWGDDTPNDNYPGASSLAWYALHGNKNIDFWHIAQILYGVIPDGTQQYDVRMLAYDQPGNMNPDWAVPFTFTSDVTPPEVVLTDCLIDGLPADFGDGVICNTGTYTLTVENTTDVTTVYFQSRISTDEGVTWSPWVLIGTDESLPFTWEWDASGIIIGNVPPDYYALVQFRAYAEDDFGNVQDPDSACVAEVRVEDCEAPTTWFTRIYTTDNTVGLGDHMEIGDLPNPYYYRDVIGPLQVPRGPAIDIWALFTPYQSPDSVATLVHDVIRVVFEISLAGSGIWTQFETVTGEVNVVDGDTMSVDLTLPVAVTLETEALATGTYDIRVYSCDIEGNNCPDVGAPSVQYDIAKITVVEEGLRAYIQPVLVDCTEDQQGTGFDLYAINWIHDYFINKVLFQYYDDSDGDGIDNDGNDWVDIATDDGTSADPRGDIVLRRGTVAIEDLTGRVAFVSAGDSLETYIDYDNDGYSARDPIILDANADLMFDTADGDNVILGDLTEILSEGVFALKLFETTEFHTGADRFDPTEWIFAENQSTVPPAQATGTLNLWSVYWDVSGIDQGTYLVRAVATDDMFAVDDTTTSPSVIPTEPVSIDALAPTAIIAEVTTPDNVTQDAVNDLYFSGETGWLKICATSTDTDLSGVTIQFRIPGHDSLGGWNDLDVNDDEDFYADIDGVPGFSAGDEIYLDAGTVPYIWDAGDILLYAGENGHADAQNMATPPALIPLYNYEFAGADTLYEELDNSTDDDHDGMVDEDLFNAEDWFPPYCVYFPIGALGLISDTNIEFRAVASDQSCNTDPDPLVVRFMIGETQTPETDVVWVKLSDGTEIDYLNEISDGDCATQLTAADIMEPVTLLVTAEDATAITQMDLMFRRSSTCNGLEEWDNPWLSMSDEGFILSEAPDENYDFLMTVDLEALVAAHGYGVYEFYAQAMDNEGNVTPVQVNPYIFNIMLNGATLTGIPLGMVTPGDEYWFTAELAYPDSTATVCFMYAERLLDVVIDATRITPDPEHATYQTLPLELAMVDPGTNAVLTIDGVVGDFYETAEALIAGGGAGDWTYDSIAVAIEFKILPAADAVILVSYNITEYQYLWVDGTEMSCDNEAPYSAGWSAADGHNAPFPQYPETDAYDIIAVVTSGAGGCCGQYEAQLSEGGILILEDELAPNVHLYGGGLWYTPPPDTLFWPGNPSFPTVAGLTEWKLSGVEHQFFATSDSSDVASMDLILTKYGEGVVTTVPMTLYGPEDETIPMTFTLYQTDFPEAPYDWENVTLQLEGHGYPMTETVSGNGIWQVIAPVLIGAVSDYEFDIDQVGNDFMSVPDPRNKIYNSPNWESTVNVPDAPVWFVDAPDFGTATTVWHVQARATDSVGNVGTSHLYTFVYDPVAPTIDEVTADAVRFGSADSVTVTAIVTDQEVVPGYDFNVITVMQILVQYSPNYAAPEADRIWLEYGYDTDPSDGWAVTRAINFNPVADGFDNDGDGEWDEADEATSAMAWRVFAMDDGNNWGPAVVLVLPFTLDDTPPVAVLTTPVNGDVFPYGSTFEVAATITDTEEDIAYVLFQYNAGDGWMDIDITPEDNTDHPYDTTAPYAVSFNTTDYLDEADTYVRFRAVAVDVAGNEDPEPMEVLVVVNDITGPTAYAMWAKTSGAVDYTPLSDPRLAVNGHDVMIKGVAVDPSGRENLAWVRVQYQLADTDIWTDIGIVPSDDFVLAGFNEFTVGWSVSWDVIGLAEGMYSIRAIAADIDGNQDPNPIAGTLRIDHTGPEVLYEPIAGLYDGFAPYAAYENDGAPGSSNAFTPDPATGDIVFTVITRSADIESIILQGHQAGADSLGEWIDAPSGYFDFESNLTFEYGGETYYVWRLHLDNGRDYAEIFGISGVYEVRALATDFAGNQNILHDALNNWLTWTVDVDDPVMLDFHSSLGAESDVASGEDVTFTAVMTDSTTDVVTVRFEYSSDGGNTWAVIDPNPATEEIEAVTLIPENIDTPFARWTGVVTWTTPDPVVTDMAYEVRAIFYDTVGNEGESEHLVINVEDNTKPEFTKIWAIPAQVNWVDDTYYGEAGDGYAADCENQDHDGLYIDMNGNNAYDAGTDVAIDFGYLTPDGYALLEGSAGAGKTIGLPNNTWPRYIDEIVLGGELEKLVSHEVTLVARTQIDDTGLERVEFYAVNAAGDSILVGADECPPAYDQWNYLWHVRWNTLATDEHGDPIYPDGVYRIVPIAYDLEGNVEDWVDDLSAAVTVTVDNTAPEAITTLVPTTVERNEMLSLRAETDVDGLQDDVVEFFFKRSTDLNMAAAWMWVDEADGVDASDVNPDSTRPYVFDWDLDKMDVPFPLEDPIVGLTYHVAASSWDILDNGRDEVLAFEAGDFATFTVVDTKAPAATITEIARATGDTDPITLPHLMGPIHARDLAYLKAKILGYENDTEKVEFMWAPVGDTTPMLIDAQVTKDPDDFYTWQISDWDLRPLSGQTIEVFAVGYDDVGNRDFDTETGRPIVAPFFTLVVDYDAPTVEVVTPFDGMKACRVDSENRYYNLIFTSPDADVDLNRIAWEYKLSADVDAPENWNACVLTAPGVIWDVNSETFAAAWDVLADSTEVTQLASNLYDVRLTVYDVAGNVYTTAGVPNGDAQLIVIDVTAPWGEITRVDVDGESFYPTLPIDITRGETIDLWATASDIEEGVPLGTGVKEIIFQVLGSRQEGGSKSGPGDSDEAWRDIGFWQAPTGTLFEEVEASVTWNTSGEPEDTYYVRIKVADDECNTYESGNVTLVITDQEPPRARIAGFDPWQIPHGDNRTTYCDVYAVAYSDSLIEEVQFQYSTDGTEWIPFGITGHIDPSVDGEHSDWGTEMCDLWYATIDLSSFSVEQQVWFRAIANDDANNHDPLPPTVLTQVVRYDDGSLDLAAVESLPDLDEMSLILEGGEHPDDFIVRVDMGRADQRPYVLYLPPTPVGQGGQPWCVAMIRMIDTEFSLSWQGAVKWIWDDCGKSTVFAGALSDDNEIDLHVQHVWSWDVDYVLGSNGTARVAGYRSADTEQISYLYATATVPSASGGSDEGGCLLLSPSTVPMLTPDDARYLEMIPRTGYAMGWIEDENHEVTPGYPWTMTIEYDEAGLRTAVAEMLDIPASDVTAAQIAEVEPYVTVRAFNWYDDPTFAAQGWTGAHIWGITADPTTNTVSFYVSEWCYLRPHFALFVPRWDAPVAVRIFTPWSPYASRWNYTDCDPKIVIDLNGTGTEPIDPYTIEVYIDGNQVAACLAGGNWAEGNGSLDVQAKNFEQTRFQVYYQHSENRAWWLTEGVHTLNVTYKHVNGTGDWISLPANGPGATFWVDNTAPYVEFHGGWIDNPLLRNVAGYINPFHQESMLTVYMYDAGAGILVRPEHLYPLFGSGAGSDSVTWHDDVIEDDQVIGDPGIKYDLWLVHDEDDQTEVDEIEERLLLHSGTADEIIPYITPPLFATTGGYEPTDTMIVRLPIVAGGRTHDIQDGDIIEVTLYTKKHIEHMDDYTVGCDASVIVNYDPETGLSDTLATVSLDCYYDRLTGLHVYDRGIYDWAGNSGSKYVEQRFIVDMTPPTATLIYPVQGWVAPGEDFDFEIWVQDGGSGVASASAKLFGPDGVEITDGVTIQVNGNRITGHVIGGLPPGTYTVVVTVTDQAGNSGTVSVPIVVQAAALGMYSAYVSPNPSNPDDNAAMINFTLSRQASVSIKVYDFAGEYVSTVLSSHVYAGAGHYSWPWAGQGSDGTALANGAYIIRIEAQDGSAKKTANVKAVIWRD